MNAKEQIVVLPLKSITAKSDWNGRFAGGGDTPLWSQDSGGDEENDWTAFKMSIQDRGQDTPVVVRPKGQRFELVCGFRRFRAILELAEAKGDKEPTIKAVVREYDDLQARLANLRENTERQDFRPADLCWTTKEALAEYRKKKVDVTQVMLAADVGKSQSFVARLLAIADNLDPRILDDWRVQARDISVNKVYELSKVPKVDQRKAWEAMKQAQASKTAEKKPPTDAEKLAKKVENLCNRAASFGMIIGTLVKFEVVLLPDGEPFDQRLACESLLSLGTLSQKDLRPVYRAMKAAFDQALVEEEEPEEEEEIPAA